MKRLFFFSKGILQLSRRNALFYAVKCHQTTIIMPVASTPSRNGAWPITTKTPHSDDLRRCWGTLLVKNVLMRPEMGVAAQKPAS